MKNYFNYHTGKCNKEGEYRKNKKEDFCKECTHNIGIEYTLCRFLRDERF